MLDHGIFDSLIINYYGAKRFETILNSYEPRKEKQKTRHSHERIDNVVKLLEISLRDTC